MARWIKVGRWFLRADLAPKVTGLEEDLIIEGEAAEQLRAYLNAQAVPWKPVQVGPHPRGPLKSDRFQD
jgi:hypothetical protein